MHGDIVPRLFKDLLQSKYLILVASCHWGPGGGLSPPKFSAIFFFFINSKVKTKQKNSASAISFSPFKVIAYLSPSFHILHVLFYFCFNQSRAGATAADLEGVKRLLGEGGGTRFGSIFVNCKNDSLLLHPIKSL